MPKSYIKTKILLQVCWKNTPLIQCGVTLYFLTIAVVNKLLFFDCAGVFSKILIKFNKMAFSFYLKSVKCEINILR